MVFFMCSILQVGGVYRVVVKTVRGIFHTTHTIFMNTSELRSQASAAYRNKDFATAHDLFTQCIHVEPTESNYVNRALTNIKLNVSNLCVCVCVCVYSFVPFIRTFLYV